MPVRRPAKIPEAILHLQQQLDQWPFLFARRVRLGHAPLRVVSRGESLKSENRLQFEHVLAARLRALGIVSPALLAQFKLGKNILDRP
jgi:hypothetical protein